MGERLIYQPLTREDRITVVLYRSGIVASAAILSCLAVIAVGETITVRVADVLLYCLNLSVGMSVFFIHLYVRVLKRYLIALYVLGLAGLAVLLFSGAGAPAVAVAQRPLGPLLLLPLAGCLGFVTAKEAFCFQLNEGYLLAMLMPALLLLSAGGLLAGRVVAYSLVLLACLMVLFTLRKVFQPLAYDIGDKSAYR